MKLLQCWCYTITINHSYKRNGNKLMKTTRIVIILADCHISLFNLYLLTANSHDFKLIFQCNNNRHTTIHKKASLIIRYEHELKTFVIISFLRGNNHLWRMEIKNMIILICNRATFLRYCCAQRKQNTHDKLGT